MDSTTKIVILLLTFIVSTNANAQFGIKAGINIPNVSVDNGYSNVKINTDEVIGFNFGAFLDFKQYNNFTLSSGLTYQRKSIKGKGFANPLSTAEAEMYIDYVVYSVTAKYLFVPKENTSTFLSIAPRLNFYVGNKYEPKGFTLSQSQRDIVTNNIRKLGFGVSFGAGIDFARKSSVSPFFELLFSPDFYNAYEDGLLSFKSNAIEANIGLRFK